MHIKCKSIPVTVPVNSIQLDTRWQEMNREQLNHSLKSTIGCYVDDGNPTILISMENYCNKTWNMFVTRIASYRLHHENDTLNASREYHFAPDLFSIINICYVCMRLHFGIINSFFFFIVGAIDCMMHDAI